MNLQHIKQNIDEIAIEASFIFFIENIEEHRKALELMSQLLEDYDSHELLINLLSMSIEKYENSAEEFTAFNKSLTETNSGAAALAVLMDQYNLNTTDFIDEIGGKSLVSMILNGKRQLNLRHIRNLSERFNVPAQVFI